MVFVVLVVLCFFVCSFNLTMGCLLLKTSIRESGSVVNGVSRSSFQFSALLSFKGISGVLIYLTVLFVSKWGDYSELIADVYTLIPAGVIFVFSILLFLVAAIGLCGTCKENRCTLGVVSFPC